MKFGVIVPTGFRLDLSHAENLRKQYEKVEQTAMKAEELGYDSLWVFDHLLSLQDDYPCLEAWTTLCGLAKVTKKIRLGTMVLNNSFRHPVVLAKMASTLDHICNGRLELGLGAGWYKKEYKAYGFQYLPISKRVDIFKESVKIIKMLWTQERVTYSGTKFSLKEAVCRPKPLQRPHPPIWIAAKGNRMLRIVSKQANGWNMRGSPKEFKERAEVLNGYLKNEKRDVHTLEKSVIVFVTLGRDRDSVKERLKRALLEEDIPQEHMDYPLRDKMQIFFQHPKRIFPYLKHKMHLTRTRQAYQPIHSFELAGMPEECGEILLQYKKAGATHIILYFTDVIDIEPLELFVDEVKPIIS